MTRGRFAAVVGAALALAEPAQAHVIPSPTFLAAGETQTIELSVPNERDAPMTSLVVRAPEGIEVLGAESPEGWSAAVAGPVVTWSGGSTPALLSETFGLRVRATGAPGAVELDAEQRYADGKVSWPVALTLVPGSAEPSGEQGSSGVVAAVIAAAGVLVAAGIALLAWRRRTAHPLHEGAREPAPPPDGG